jgi:hypothetical protein
MLFIQTQNPIKVTEIPATGIVSQEEQRNEIYI